MNMTIPSSFWESTAGLATFHVSAVCVGVRRAATTLLYQIVRDVFPEGGVLKTHSFLDVGTSVPVIGTYRDFRDCAVSWWRTTMHDQAARNADELAKQASQFCPWTLGKVDLQRTPRDKMGIEEAADAVCLVKRDLFHLEMYKARGKNILLLRYEDFCQRPIRIKWPVGTHLGRPIPSRIFARHSAARNAKLARFTDEPQGEIPQEPHCHGGQAGAWAKFCDDDVTAFLNSAFRDELEAYGYL